MLAVLAAAAAPPAEVDGQLLPTSSRTKRRSPAMRFMAGSATADEAAAAAYVAQQFQRLRSQPASWNDKLSP